MEKITEEGKNQLKNIYGKDENLVSKKEALIKTLKQHRSIEYLTKELFISNPQHELFKKMSERKLAELRKIKFVRMKK